MLSYLIGRILVLVASLVAAAAAIFFVLEILPGDPALVILGLEAGDDTLAALRAELGLDRPVAVRFADWVIGLLQFQTGVSHTYGVSVGGLIAQSLAVTVPLALMAFLLAVIVGLPLGVFAAARRNRFGDYGVIAFSQTGMAVPNFWLAILLVLLFAITLGWLPSGGFDGWRAGVWPGIESLLLPALALGLPEAAILARVTRSAVLETLSADFVRTARAKGVSERRILLRHVLYAAFIPVLTILGLQVAILLAGSIVVERIFFLPGLGKLVFQAVSQRDLVTVRDAVMLIVAAVIVINFAVDALASIIDPRPKVRA
jgi:peptide/nickel transport system permease protein